MGEATQSGLKTTDLCLIFAAACRWNSSRVRQATAAGSASLIRRMPDLLRGENERLLQMFTSFQPAIRSVGAMASRWVLGDPSACRPRRSFQLFFKIFDLDFAFCPFWWQKPPFWQNGSFRMNWGIRGCALAAGAAALLSTQAVYAAPPAPRSVGVDPLVTLSVLGTTQSRVSLVAAASAVQDAPPAMQTCPDGSVIPVTATCATAPVPPPPGIGPLPLILGLVVFIGLMAAIISGGDNARGDLTPVSPA